MSKCKLLYILNVANRVNNFSYTSMLAAQTLDIEYHIAGNWGYNSAEERFFDEQKYGIRIHQIDFIRTPYNPKNYIAYKQLKSLVENEKFDIIHCNTPIGGLLGRIVAIKCHTKAVIYQAHGFHFYRGSSALNWIIYYPIERFMANNTDALITINKEDYAMAQKFQLRNKGKVFYVPGVGIALNEYEDLNFNRNAKRAELGLNNEDVGIISAGDLVARKNYKVSIEAVARVNNRKLHYFVCGNGPEHEKLYELTEKLNINQQVHFLGFRSDIKELFRATDIFLLTSLQEGLPRSLMEAMASGLPCITSSIRGNVDLITNGVNGFLCKPTDVDEFVNAINILITDRDLAKTMKENGKRTIEYYKNDIVKENLKEIYRDIISDLAH